MNDIKIIRLFNPELNNLSNQLLIIDLKKKKYNNRILSIQNFMEKYPYYNNDEFKYFYPEKNNYSNSEILSKIMQIDYGKLFSIAILLYSHASSIQDFFFSSVSFIIFIEFVFNI